MGFSKVLVVQIGGQVSIVLKELTACIFYHQMAEGCSSETLVMRCKLHGVKILCVCVCVAWCVETGGGGGGGRGGREGEELEDELKDKIKI